MHPLRLSGVLASVLFLSSAAAAQVPTTSSAPIESRIDQLVERLDALRVEHHVPGLGLAVVTPDGVFTRGIGLADLESGVPAHAGTLFEIGSTTKTFTSVLTAMLVDDGDLDFDDPVRDHVPYFHLKDPKADAEVTLRDLLSHRTGLTRTDLTLCGGDALTLEDVVRQLAKAEPLAGFRKQFLYNNQMFMVAGLACESVGGASYAELVEERIFEPLGMSRSSVSLARFADDEDLATGYRWLDGQDLHDVAPTHGIRLSEAAGAIISCPEDMARYLTFLIAQGAGDDGETLLSAGLFEDDLWQPQNRMGPEDAYGLGFMLGRWRGRDVIHHGGNIDGFTSQMAVLPEEGIGFSLLMNVSMSGLQARAMDEVFAILLGEVEEAPDESEGADAPFTPAELEAYVGDYDLEVAGQIWTVLLKDGRLALDVPGQTKYTLAWPDEDDKWAFEAAPQVTIRFHVDEDGTVQAYTLFQAGAELHMPRRVEDTGLPSTDEVLALLDQAVPPAAVQAIRPLRVEGDVDFIHQGLTGRFTMVMQDATHFRIDLDFGKFGRIATVVNGDQGWTYVPLQGRIELSGTQLAETARDAPVITLSETRDQYESLKVLADEGEGEDRELRLKATPKLGAAATYHIDHRGRVTRVDAATSLGEAGAIPIQVTFKGHREVHGIHFADVTEVMNSFTGMTRMTTTAIHVNVEIPEGLWADL